jgi:Secretion system C-terminal sorting domain
MTKFFLLILFGLTGAASFSQRIERSLVGTAGQTFVSGGLQLSYSIGETAILPSPSVVINAPTVPMMASIGFQQPHIALTGGLISANNWVSAYPNPTTGHVRLDIHGDNFQVNYVRLYNALGQEVVLKPFVMVNGSIDLQLGNLPAGIYFVCVTDKTIGNTISTRILKQNK